MSIVGPKTSVLCSERTRNDNFDLHHALLQHLVGLTAWQHRTCWRAEHCYNSTARTAAQHGTTVRDVVLLLYCGCTACMQDDAFGHLF